MGAHPTDPCRITKLLLPTQAQPAFGSCVRQCKKLESWWPNAPSLPPHSDWEKPSFFFFEVGSKQFPPRPLCQQSAYLACGADTVGEGNLTGTSLSKCCQSSISHTCIPQDGILVSTEAGKDSGAETLCFFQTASPVLSWVISDSSLHLLSFQCLLL